MSHDMLVSRTAGLCALLATGAVMFGAASCTPTRSRTPEQERDDVIAWALGTDTRELMPPTGDGRLIRARKGSPVSTGTKVAETCAGATSFVPAPGGDPRFFYACKGRLHVGQDQVPVPVEGLDESIYLRSLIAFGHARSPLELLAVASPKGSTQVYLLLLTLSERAVLASKPVRGRADFRDREAFFSAYRAPRCLQGGKQCLRIARPHDGECYLDVEEDGGRMTEIQDVSHDAVRDVAWASPDGTTLLWLVRTGSAP